MDSIPWELVFAALVALAIKVMNCLAQTSQTITDFSIFN